MRKWRATAENFLKQIPHAMDLTFGSIWTPGEIRKWLSHPSESFNTDSDHPLFKLSSPYEPTRSFGIQQSDIVSLGIHHEHNPEELNPMSMLKTVVNPDMKMMQAALVFAQEQMRILKLQRSQPSRPRPDSTTRADEEATADSVSGRSPAHVSAPAPRRSLSRVGTTTRAQAASFTTGGQSSSSSSSSATSRSIINIPEEVQAGETTFPALPGDDDDDRDDVPFYINLESINISSICFFRLIASFSAA